MAVERAFWEGRRVLVTGHTGFKGSWLVLWLESMGAQVTGLACDRMPLFEIEGESIDGDVRDPDAVARAVDGAEVVFHMAAQPIVRRSYREPAETYDVNVMGTARVLDGARDAGVAATVVVTSDKCYENRSLDRGYREDEPLGGLDPYSSSKACQELVAHAYRRSYELPLATGRAGNVIGGGDFGEDRLVPDVMRSAIAGEPVAIRNPHAVRPWQHVLEPLSGYIELAQRVHAGDAPDALNFGPAPDDAKPVGWVVERLAELWPGGIAREDVAEQDAPHEASVLMLDSSLAAERLGWRPAWELDQALRATVEWYSAHGSGQDTRAVALAQIGEHQTAR